MVNISYSFHGVLYAGTSFFLRCMITFNDLVTIPVIVRNHWTRNGISVSNGFINNSIITESLLKIIPLQYEANLQFTPLNIDNSGEYACNVDVISNISDYKYVRNISSSVKTTIRIEGKLQYMQCYKFIFITGLPSPVVVIMTSGKAVPGEEYLLNCTVKVIDRLIVTPTIIWIKNSVNRSLVSDDLKTISVPSVLRNISDTMYSLSLFFSSLNTSDAGQYTCQATITVNEINVIVTNTSVQDLILQSKKTISHYIYIGVTFSLF